MQKLKTIFNTPLVREVARPYVQLFHVCEEVGKAVTPQSYFNPELFPKNGSLRGLKRLTTEHRTQMLADKMLRCPSGDQPDAHEVDMLLKAGVNVDYTPPRTWEGGTLLDIAIRRGFAHCVTALLDHGADASAKPPGNLTAFQQAAYQGQDGIMRILLARGADIAARTGHGMTPLMLVVNGQGGARRRGCIELLLARGVSLDDKDNEGRTAMDWFNQNRYAYGRGPASIEWAKPLLDTVADIAARKKKEDATQRLLKAVRNTGAPGGSNPDPKALQRYIDDGADIERLGNDHWESTPLAILATYNCVEPIKVLIAAGANVSPRHPRYGGTPLTTASFFGYVELMQVLLDNGAKLEEADNDGKTPLINAMYHGCRTEAVKLLIARGANLEAADNSGKTVFDYCTEKKKDTRYYGDGKTGYEVYTELEHILLLASFARLKDSGKPLASKGSDWCVNVLCAAAATNDKDIVAQILDAGIGVSLKNTEGFTALHAAASAGNADMVEYLIGRGAFINALDAENRTPLICATHAKCHTKVANILLDHGAYADVTDKWGSRALGEPYYSATAESGQSLQEAHRQKDALRQRIRDIEGRQVHDQYTQGARDGVVLNRKLRLKERKPS